MLDSSTTIATIQNQLELQLQPSYLEIIDDSHQHVGHPGASQGGHYTLIISCDAFHDKSTLDCHRMIYKALGNLQSIGIHALSIQVR